MSAAVWHFRKIVPGELVREPIQGEFFTPDSVASEDSRAVVRESIQNALDAQASEKAKVKVRIAVDTCKKVPFLENAGLWNHIRAKENGLPLDMLLEKDDCKFLLFEDFGTTGLTGDTEQYADKEGVKNHFYNFFRAIGGTDKHTSGKTRGKWGIGKHTFWAASRINTVFGCTVLAGNSDRFFMGETILKSHSVDGGYKSYQTGYYGYKQPDTDLVLPIKGRDAENAAQLFAMQRTGEKPGLSVVVPYLKKSIRMEGILKSVIGDYFYPILTSQLEVDLSGAGENGEDILLNAESIEKYADEDVKRLICLGKELMTADFGETIKPDNAAMPEWDKDMFGDRFKELSEDYRQGKEIFLRVGVAVTPKTGEPKSSYFDVAFVRNDGKKSRPKFIRSGIIIPDIKPMQKEILSLVVSEEETLADFLGAAENPAHTEWQGKRVVDKYKHASKIIKFVSGSVNDIVRVFTESDGKPDFNVLAGIFPAEDVPEPPKPEPPKPEPPKPEPPKPEPPKPASPFKIGKIERGFSVENTRDITAGKILIIRVAYLVKGDPLRQYLAADFSLENMDHEDAGLEILEIKENRVIARITQSDFKFSARGFDENRDVYVKADIEGGEYAD